MNFPHQLSSALIYDDHKLFAQSFASFLERLGVFQQVRNAGSEDDVVRNLVSLSTEGYVYFFLDYRIGEGNALHLLNDARRISRKIKVIVITSMTRPATIVNMLSYKPDAMISKSSGANVITECLEAIAGKRQYICPEMSTLISTFDASKNAKQVFSQREIEILSLFDKGLSIIEAADAAHLSRYTIVNHRSNMMKKSGTKSIVELLAYARRNGIL
ncbi:MAG TPA: response regulator transcription factor [Chitinophagaceae bacterium]|nr:response regulator transcription factor [Chitinophagaceae bacterium]